MNRLRGVRLVLVLLVLIVGCASLPKSRSCRPDGSTTLYDRRASGGWLGGRVDHFRCHEIDGRFTYEGKWYDDNGKLMLVVGPVEKRPTIDVGTLPGGGVPPTDSEKKKKGRGGQ